MHRGSQSIQCRLARGYRRGVALLLVMIAVFISAVVAYGYLAEQGTAVTVARNARDHAQARAVAESCLEIALAYVRTTPGWRGQVSDETPWTSHAELAGGTCSVRGEDGQDLDGDHVISVPAEGDGDLSSSNGGDDDVFTLTITGQFRDTKHMIRAVVVPPNSSIAGAWKFDETGGTTVNDSSGLGQNGTIYNASPPSWEAGKVNNGLRFSGNTSYVSVQDNSALDLSESGSLSIWFKMDTFKPFGGLIHKGVSPNFSDEAYTLQFWSGNQLYFGVNGDTGAQSGTLSSSTSISNNTWYHVVATWDSTGMKMYLNGQLNCQNNKVVKAKNSTGDLILGAQLPVAYNSNYKNLTFNGLFDEALVMNRSLSAAEVAGLFNLTTPSGGGSGSIKVDLLR